MKGIHQQHCILLTVSVDFKRQNVRLGRIVHRLVNWRWQIEFQSLGCGNISDRGARVNIIAHRGSIGMKRCVIGRIGAVKRHVS